jgi:hypothetical protein
MYLQQEYRIERVRRTVRLLSCSRSVIGRTQIPLDDSAF